jgi:hypothetical protein
MPSYLLDKSVARRIIEALHHLDNLSYEEELVLELWRHLQDEQARLFIPTGVVNILQRFAHLLEVHTFLAAVEPLESGRYLKRWARRLRRYNFTREDALVLALATYGTDMDGDIMGVDWLITLDRPFIQNFETRRAELQIRLRAMTAQLQAPYRHATLPKVLHPEEKVGKPGNW